MFIAVVLFVGIKGGDARIDWLSSARFLIHSLTLSFHNTHSDLLESLHRYGIRQIVSVERLQARYNKFTYPVTHTCKVYDSRSSLAMKQLSYPADNCAFWGYIVFFSSWVLRLPSLATLRCPSLPQLFHPSSLITSLWISMLTFYHEINWDNYVYINFLYECIYLYFYSTTSSLDSGEPEDPFGICSLCLPRNVTSLSRLAWEFFALQRPASYTRGKETTSSPPARREEVAPRRWSVLHTPYCERHL